MKIGFLMHGIGWGGAAGSLMLLLKSIDKMDAQKHFITSIDRHNKAREEFIKLTDSFKVISLPHLNNHAAGGNTSLKDFNKIISGDYSLLLNYLDALDLDILHVNSTVFAYLLEPIRIKLNIKIICHVRETLPDYHNGVVKKYIVEQITKFSDKIICISNNEASYFSGSDNVIVMANPFNFSLLNNINTFYRKSNNIDNETVLVAMSGNFSRLKGHLHFLQAVNHIIKNNLINHKAYFLVLGVGKTNPGIKTFVKKLLGKKDFGNEFKHYLKKNNLNNYIDVIPMLYTNTFYSLLKEIDIYVRPSLAGDPWGRDIIEAMAFNKPIVATGTSEFYVKNGVNGYLVSPKNYVELAHSMAKLINNKNNRNKLAKNNSAKIKEMCELSTYGKYMESILLNLYEN